MPYLTIKLRKLGDPRLVIPSNVIRALTEKYKSFTLSLAGNRVIKVREDQRAEISSDMRAKLKLRANTPYQFRIREGPGMIRLKKWGKVRTDYPYPAFYHKGFSRKLIFNDEEGYDFEYCWNRIRNFIEESWRMQREITTRFTYAKVFFWAMHSKLGELIDIITSGTYALMSRIELDVMINDLEQKFWDTILKLERGVHEGYIDDFSCLLCIYSSFSEYRHGKKQRGF